MIDVVADAVGETAEFVAKAVATKCDGGDVEIGRISYVEDMDDVDDVVKVAKNDFSNSAYTVVVASLKDYLDNRAQVRRIIAVDLLEPWINGFTTRFNKEPQRRPGFTRKLDDDY